MKQDLRISVTKRMIKEALIDLLHSKPLSKIRVNELCEHSGVNRTTFYRHYESLQDVLQEIEADFIKQLYLPNKLPKDMADAKEHVETVCTYVYEHSDIVKLLFLNMSDTDFLKSIYKFYREFLEVCHEDIPIKELDEDTIQIIIALLCGGALNLIRKWILDDINKSPKEIANILCNVIRFPVFPPDFLLE